LLFEETQMTQIFGAESTTDDVLAGIDLAGQRILVTGVSSGLGVETARSLAAHGAWVVGAARDLAKARAATADITAPAGSGGGLELVELDLASLASVRACADALVAAGKPFDVIIANAGIMACPQATTADGFELQFGTNHLGHFVLVNRISALLKPGGRLVVLSSGAHQVSDVDLEDPNFVTTPYTEFGAYGRAKTANALFAVAFDARHKARGVRAVAVHPGVINTGLGRHMAPEVAAQLEAMLSAPPPGVPALTFKSVAQGAATSVWAGLVATAEAVGGTYCEDCHVAEVGGSVQPYAIDPARAEALWAKSEEMVGEHYR
jgi:NAD(P)-dependent dehydrogenase (short-subunit alcohol dehydrogenase family)